MQQAVAILKSCQLFAAVHETRLQRLAESAACASSPKAKSFFAKRTSVRVCMSSVKAACGSTVSLPTARSTCSTWWGPAGLLPKWRPSRVSTPPPAQAVTAAVCVLLPLDFFRKQLEEDHPLCLEVLRGLSFWVRHTITLLEDIVLRDAAGRVARFLLEAEPEDDDVVKLPGLKRHVASHLNLTSETFSRTLSRLIEGGLIIDLEGNRVQLLDRLKLKAISEGMFPQF